jgi:hypothetical protein
LFAKQAYGHLDARKQIMSDRLELLCAEVQAIDYFEWHYQHALTRNESDELSHELRLERREQIVSAMQVIFAKSRLVPRG